jgi:hypothetical protein
MGPVSGVGSGASSGPVAASLSLPFVEAVEDDASDDDVAQPPTHATTMAVATRRAKIPVPMAEA